MKVSLNVLTVASNNGDGSCSIHGFNNEEEVKGFFESRGEEYLGLSGDYDGYTIDKETIKLEIDGNDVMLSESFSVYSEC